MKEKKFHTIYLSKNLVNGKQYIGLHSTDDLDDKYLGSCTALIADVKKYGRDNFRKTILSIHETRQEAIQKEEELVNDDWLNRGDVYNIRVGGETCKHSRAGTKLSEETKRKISESKKGTKRPDVAEYNRREKKGKTIIWSAEANAKRRSSNLAFFQTPAGIEQRRQMSERMTKYNQTRTPNNN